MHTASTTPSMADKAADAHSSSVHFSRSAGLFSQSGNADSELKTRVADGVADDFRKLARSFDMTTSEFLRILILARLYGNAGVARMAEDQINQVAGNGPALARG
jgi:hypothetical protein